MSTATGRDDRQAANPTASEHQRDLYDPYFPLRRRAKEASDQVRGEVSDPYFKTRTRR